MHKAVMLMIALLQPCALLAAQNAFLHEQRVGAHSAVIQGPGKRMISFASCDRGRWEGSGGVWRQVEYGYCDVFLTNNSGSFFVKLTRSRRGEEWDPSGFFPDRSILAMERRFDPSRFIDPRLHRLDWFGRRSYLFSVPSSRVENAFDIHPGGAVILFSQMTGLTSSTLIAFDLRSRSPTDYRVLLGDAHAGFWGRDGSIFFRGGDGNLFRANSAARDITQITSFDHDPMRGGRIVDRFTQSGEYLVSIKSPPTFPIRTYLIRSDADGSNPQQLVRDPEILSPDLFHISPSDEWVAFRAYFTSTGSSELFIVSLVDGSIECLSQHDPNVGAYVDGWDRSSTRVLTRRITGRDDPNETQVDLGWISIRDRSFRPITHSGPSH